MSISTLPLDDVVYIMPIDDSLTMIVFKEIYEGQIRYELFK